MSSAFDLARNLLALVGLLGVAVLGASIAWVAKEAVADWRCRRDRLRREADSAMKSLHADIEAFEAGERP